MERDLKLIVADLINWAYEVNGKQGVRDARQAAQITDDEMRELGLEDYLEETFTGRVCVSDWDGDEDEEGNKLPSYEEIIEFTYTEEELNDHDDLDDLAGDKLFEMFGVAALDYIVL